MGSPATVAETMVSFHPDQMEQGGLPGSGEGFDGQIDSIDIGPWDYNGRAHNIGSDGREFGWCLAARIHYIPDEDSGVKPFYDYQKLANLTAFLPSSDGVTPIALPDDLDDLEGLDPEEMSKYFGPYAVKVGTQKKLNSGSKFAEWTQCLLDAADEKQRQILLASIGPRVDWAAGLVGHFNRVSQKERSGLTQEAGARQKEILVCTAIHALPGAAPSVSKGKPAAAAASVPAAAAGAATSASSSAATSDEFNAKLYTVILGALATAAGNTMPMQALPATVMGSKQFAGKELAAALGLSVDKAHLASLAGVTFDPTTGMLSLG